MGQTESMERKNDRNVRWGRVSWVQGSQEEAGEFLVGAGGGGGDSLLNEGIGGSLWDGAIWAET